MFSKTERCDRESMKEQIDNIANVMQKDELVVFVGSGVSIAAPSNLPSGVRMRNGIIHELCKRDPIFKEYEEKIIAEDLNPEMVYSIILQSIGRNLFKTHNVCDIKRFNANHLFLAHAAKNGKLSTIVTTNFDHLIEDAMQHLGLKPQEDFYVYKDRDGFRTYLETRNIFPDERKIYIIKIHGSVEDQNSMIVTMDQTGKGLMEEQANILDYLLHERYFLFVGYSGNDVDIYPKLLRSKCKGLWWVVLPDSSNPRVTELIAGNNRNRRLISYDLNQLFKMLSVRLGFDVVVPFTPEKSVNFDELLYNWANCIDILNIYKCMAFLLGFFGQNQGSFLCLQEWEQNSRMRNDQHELALCLNSMGTFYKVIRRDYAKALECYKNSIEISREIDDQLLISDNFNDIGALHGDQGDYQKAKDDFQQSLDIAQRIGAQNRIGYYQQNMGTIYWFSHDLKNALKYHKQALKSRLEIGDQIGVANSLYNVGVVYRDLNEIERCIDCQTAGLRILIRLGYTTDVINQWVDEIAYLGGNPYYEDEIFADSPETLLELVQYSEND